MVEFNWSKDWSNILLGISFLNGVSENMETGELKEEYIISIGFIFFTIKSIKLK